MSISTVGAAGTNSGPDAVTVPVSPTAAGDILVLATDSAGATEASSASGGGVTSWTKGTSYLDTSVNVYIDAWFGVITTTGASTVTVTGLAAGAFNSLWAQQFHESGAGFTWSLVTANPAAGSSGASSGSGTSVTFPSLACSGADDYLYVGRAFSVFGNMNAGSTSGFTYTNAGSTARQVCYDQTASGTVQPTATQTNTGAYDVAAMIIGATSPASPTSGPPLSLRLPNFPAVIAVNSGWRNAGHSR